MKIRFYQILSDDKKAYDALTPASLEAIILRKYPVNAGDFMFIEWTKLDDEILVTSERTALIAKDACTFTIIMKMKKNIIIYLNCSIHKDTASIAELDIAGTQTSADIS